jgi:hypothetical protein
MKVEEAESGPLAVCVYDCDLDFGQPEEELIKLCFRVNCAFAEMRWGQDDDKAPVPPLNLLRRLNRAS